MTDSAVATREHHALAYKPGFQLLPIDLIDRSNTNPRKTFDQVKLAELAESIKSHGVLQPILVRYNAKTRVDRFELVAGERRWRASKLAGMTEIPANLQELDDLQTLEIQVIENLQRDDLHELEEAEGYERLQKTHHFTVDQLAEKVGKSKAYIYARLKLTACCPAVRKAFMAGDMDASIALLLARIPLAKLQEQAMQEIVKPKYGEPMSYRRAAEHVRTNYMLRLDQAPFSTSDAELVKAAGSCAACPKRTGNAPDLFGDVGNDNVCTDPACFGDKRDVAAKRLVEEAKAAGREVLVGKAAKKVLPWAYADPEDYVKLEDTIPNDEKRRTYAKALGKSAADKVVLCEHPTQPGTFVELLKDADAKALLKAKGIEIKAPAKVKMPGESAQDRKERAEREAFRAVNFATYLALRDLVGTEGLSNVELREIVRERMGDIDVVEGRLLALWGVKADEYGNAEDDTKLFAAIDNASGSDLLKMVLDVCFSPGPGLYQAKDDSTGLTQPQALAKARGIDIEAIEKKVRAEIAAKAAEAKPTKKGKKS